MRRCPYIRTNPQRPGSLFSNEGKTSIAVFGPTYPTESDDGLILTLKRDSWVPDNTSHRYHPGPVPANASRSASTSGLEKATLAVPARHMYVLMEMGLDADISALMSPVCPDGARQIRKVRTMSRRWHTTAVCDT